MNTDKKMLNRVVGASLVGATIEWYDFFLYGVVAGIVFNKLYFPSDDPVVGTMLAYGTFAVGFLSRPLGGVIFGHFGDKLGRKSMLVLTLMIMGFATVFIGLVPTYDSIGIWAPILLLILRIAQGLGLGGEWGGAVLMAYEYAPKEKKGLYASIPQVGLALGLCLASGVIGALSYFLTDEQFMSWGWRIAFIISFVLVFLGLYIRTRVTESPEFEKAKKQEAPVKIPLKEAITRSPGNILAGMGARYIDGVFFNIFGVFSIVYLTGTESVGREIALVANREDALMGVMWASMVMIIFIPLFSWLSDVIGRTKVYFWGSIITGLSAFAGFAAMNMSGGNILLIYLAIIIPFGVFYASVYGPEAALFVELFDVEVRYSGISFVYQFSGIFASGITPMIATWLLYKGDGSPWLVCAYVMFAAVISAYSATWIGRNNKHYQTAK